MSVNFYTKDCDYKIPDKVLIKSCINLISNEYSYSIDTINIIITSDTYLLNLNQQYLKKNTYTDIITFDYTLSDIINSEIFISIDRVRENAKKFSCTEKQELFRVIIHGLLHIVGYKDNNDERKMIMHEKEVYYMKRCDII